MKQAPPLGVFERFGEAVALLFSVRLDLVDVVSGQRLQLAASKRAMPNSDCNAPAVERGIPDLVRLAEQQVVKVELDRFEPHDLLGQRRLRLLARGQILLQIATLCKVQQRIRTCQARQAMNHNLARRRLTRCSAAARSLSSTCSRPCSSLVSTMCCSCRWSRSCTAVSCA